MCERASRPRPEGTCWDAPKVPTSRWRRWGVLPGRKRDRRCEDGGDFLTGRRAGIGTGTGHRLNEFLSRRAHLSDTQTCPKLAENVEFIQDVESSNPCDFNDLRGFRLFHSPPSPSARDPSDRVSGRQALGRQEDSWRSRTVPGLTRDRSAPVGSAVNRAQARSAIAA
jgi:hypothetical protein